LFGGWGFAPHPTGGAYSAPADPLAVFRGPTSREGRVGGRGEGSMPIEMIPPPQKKKILNMPLSKGSLFQL